MISKDVRSQHKSESPQDLETVEWADSEQRRTLYEMLREIKYGITKMSKQQETTRNSTVDLYAYR